MKQTFTPHYEMSQIGIENFLNRNFDSVKIVALKDIYFDEPVGQSATEEQEVKVTRFSDSNPKKISLSEAGKGVLYITDNNYTNVIAYLVDGHLKSVSSESPNKDVEKDLNFNER